MANDNPGWWTNWDLAYTPNEFGQVLGGGSVQEAFYNTLWKWFPTYVSEINRKLGSEILAVPREWRFRPDYRPMPKKAEAAILVTVPHTVGTPEIFKAGIRAQWRVDVMVYFFGTQNWQETQALTYAYAACVRTLILQQSDLGGLAQLTTWESEEYLEGEHSSTRTTGICHLSFIVTLGNVVDPDGGPASPLYAAPGTPTGPTTGSLPDQPNVATTKITISKE
jgi:hypothetical protein